MLTLCSHPKLSSNLFDGTEILFGEGKNILLIVMIGWTCDHCPAFDPVRDRKSADDLGWGCRGRHFVTTFRPNCA